MLWQWQRNSAGFDTRTGGSSEPEGGGYVPWLKIRKIGAHLVHDSTDPSSGRWSHTDCTPFFH